MSSNPFVRTTYETMTDSVARKTFTCGEFAKSLLDTSTTDIEVISPLDLVDNTNTVSTGPYRRLQRLRCKPTDEVLTMNAAEFVSAYAIEYTLDDDKRLREG